MIIRAQIFFILATYSRLAKRGKIISGAESTLNQENSIAAFCFSGSNLTASGFMPPLHVNVQQYQRPGGVEEGVQGGCLPVMGTVGRNLLNPSSEHRHKPGPQPIDEP